MYFSRLLALTPPQCIFICAAQGLIREEDLVARWHQRTSALTHQKDYSAARIAKTKGEELRALFDRCKASIEKSDLRYDGPTTELTAWALWTMAELGSESALDLLRAASGGGEALLNTTRLIGAWKLPAEESWRLQIGLGGKGAGYSAIDCKAAGHSAIDCKAAGYSAKDCKAAGYSAKDCKAAGYSLEDIVSAFDLKGTSDIVRAFGLRKLERKDDSERRVGARVLCEGKLGNITKHQVSEYAWNYVKVRYDDGTTNRDNTGGLGYVRFVNVTGEKYPTGVIWVGCSSKYYQT